MSTARLLQTALLLALSLLAAGPTLRAQTDSSRTSPALRTSEDSVSYAIGMNIGRGMMDDSIRIDPDLLGAGIRDRLAARTIMGDSAAQQVLMRFQTMLMQKQQAKTEREAERIRQLAEANEAKAEEFLRRNRHQPGVKTTASGLQYRVATEGKGRKPRANDRVRVRYKGTLLDGTEFDSSEPNGEAVFDVDEVIPGWTQALKLMKVGSTWRLWIPPDLGYGALPPPDTKIEPGAVLIFDITLLEILE